MPWYAALVLSIIVIIFCFYRKINIGVAMVLGAVTLGLLRNAGPVDLLQVCRITLLSPITLLLVLSILLLGILGHVLKGTGGMNQMIDSLSSIISDLRLIAATLPAVIGMLTVPGGAVLSAPMCGSVGVKLDVSKESQAAINLWFRHVLYFMLPLFPSLILAAQISGVPIGRFVLHNFHLTVIGLLCGFIFFFRGRSGGTGRGKNSFHWKKMLAFLRSIMPLLVILGLVVFADLYFPLAIALGILLALANYLPRERSFQAFLLRLKTMILPGINLKVAFVIVGILFYKEMLEYTAVVTDLTGYLLGQGIPVIFLILVVPFLIGMLTGDNSASVGILFPLFMPLLPVKEPAFTAYLAFLYASSTAGHIVSPAHPCFALTKEYFDVEIKGIVKLNLPLLLVVMAAAFFTTLFFGYY